MSRFFFKKYPSKTAEQEPTPVRDWKDGRVGLKANACCMDGVGEKKIMLKEGIIIREYLAKD
jgi:hypothetical protein